MARRDWYVDGTNGSDLNGGTSWLDARLTFPANGSITGGTSPSDPGDTIYFDGVCRSKLAATSKNYLTVIGTSTAWVAGETAIAQSGWTANSNAWNFTLAAGLTIKAVVYGWDTSEDAAGMRRAHLIQSADAATVAAKADSKGYWFYNSGTGVLTVYAAGANPNTSGKPVWYCNAADVHNTSAFTLTSCAGLTMRSCRFRLYVTDALGYGAYLDGCSNALVLDTTARDMGAHAVAAIGNAGPVNSVHFVNTDSRGLGAAGSHTVHYTTNANGNLTGGLVSGGTIKLCRYLGLDGAELSGASVPVYYTTGTQVGSYCHSDTGTPIAEVLYDGVTYAEVQTGTAAGLNYQAFDSSNHAEPSSGWSWSSYPVRADRCILTSGTVFRPNGSIAVRRTAFGMSNTGAAHVVGFGSIGAVAAAGSGATLMLFEACTFLFDATWAGNNTTLFGVWATSHDLRLLNCSVYDSSTQNDGSGRIMFTWNTGNDRYIRARGSVLSIRTSAAGNLCYNDSTTDAAHRDFSDNVYFGMGAGWSESATYNTQAKWLALVDTLQVVPATQPFSGAPTALTLSALSPIWVLRRATSAIIPPFGINAPYASFYGAYQYPDTGARSNRLGAAASGIGGDLGRVGRCGR